MGTNYYYDEPEEKCPACSHVKSDSRIHIGKSSFGWPFLVRVYPEFGITTLDAWKKILPSAGRIYDEYERDVTIDELMRTITERDHPNGLQRNDSDHIYGRGEGTWDYLEGEFC